MRIKKIIGGDVPGKETGVLAQLDSGVFAYVPTGDKESVYFFDGASPIWSMLCSAYPICYCYSADRVNADAVRKAKARIRSYSEREAGYVDALNGREELMKDKGYLSEEEKLIDTLINEGDKEIK